jgi:cell fate regulator YaaT (PSP1 superfamily)
MIQSFFLRFGLHGHLGVFESRLGVLFARGTKVVCRSSRGIETAVVLNSSDDSLVVRSEGEVLRPFTHNDGLLAERLERYQAQAYSACVSLLEQHGIEIPLMDIELLHDGENLFFYFLGEELSVLEPLMEKLADQYGKKIRFRQFAERLANGCGPTCGAGASSCGSGGCGNCGLSGKCSTKTA